MTNLHHIKRRPEGGFLFSATRKNECVLLDDEFKIKKVLKEDFNWVQDSEIVDDKIILADNNNSRLVFFDSSYNKIGEIEWKEGIRRVSNMIRITGLEAKKMFIQG
jgi:hypothetical protein